MDQEPSYPSVDADLGEKLYENEPDNAKKIANVIETSIRRKYKGKEARRDAHPKAHGCVRALFHVEEGLTSDLKKGLFVPGKDYPAIIRFSNGNEDPDRADTEGDGRGMAIKLGNVEGKKLLEADRGSKNHDFIMIDHPTFIIDDPSSYVSLVKIVNSENWFVQKLSPLLIAFTLGIKGTINAAKSTSKKIDNPLINRYWSMVPYQLGLGDGRKAIKFSARTCSTGKHDISIPQIKGNNFLRDTMRQHLEKTDACMDFLVQLRTSDSMSVENSREEWEETKAPFYHVATITIPQQEFDTPEQNSFCENLSFNPWRALREHRPLGAVNRVRKFIYPRISALRRSMNQVTPVEPIIELGDNGNAKINKK